MTARLLTFLVWALAAAAVVFWASRVLVKPPPAPPTAQLAVTGAGPADLTAVLGAPVAAAAPRQDESPEPEADDGRFVLVGVVAPRGAPASTQGVALIAVDGKPPRAYRVGARIDGEQIVQAVEQRVVRIGPRGAPARLELALPPPAAAATGVPGQAIPAPVAPAVPGYFQPPPGAGRMFPARPGGTPGQTPGAADPDAGNGVVEAVPYNHGGGLAGAAAQ